MAGGQVHPHVGTQRQADHDGAAAGIVDDLPDRVGRVGEAERNVGQGTVPREVEGEDAERVRQVVQLGMPHAPGPPGAVEKHEDGGARRPSDVEGAREVAAPARLRTRSPP